MARLLDDTRLITNDIPIKFINKTRRDDIRIVIFVRNKSSTINCPCVAWDMCHPNDTNTIIFPYRLEVGAHCEDERFAPVSARLGTCHDIVRERRDLPLLFKEDKTCSTLNPCCITVRNTRPTNWSGCPYNIGIYRNKKLILLREKVRVGEEVKFEITNTICFGVVRHNTLCVGDTFTPDTILGYNEFDISKFSKGMLVSLESSTGCDSYMFRVTPM